MKVVLALSGGLDSSTLLADLKVRLGHEVMPVFVNYGSKHNRVELMAANKVADYYRTDLVEFDLQEVFIHFQSALLRGGPPLPRGHYAEETMRQTVVPGRNLIIASLLAGYAESVGADVVSLGVHAGDHFIYPDCRPEFIAALQETVKRSSMYKVSVLAPFIDKTKADILTMGLGMKVPYELTRTCYTNDHKACGVCGSCQERLEAFHINGVDDPLPYVTRELIPKTS